MLQPQTTTAKFIQYVGDLAAASSMRLEVVGEEKRRIISTYHPQILLFVNYIQDSWMLPMGLTKESLVILTNRIESEQMWDFVFHLTAKSRAGMELQSGHWESIISHLVAGLSTAEYSGASTHVLLGETTVNSLPKADIMSSHLKSNPWLVTLVALNLADKVLGVANS